MSLLMMLDVGLRVEDIGDARWLVETVLDLDLDLREDGELGGVYFSHAPRPAPEEGLASVRVRPNHVEGIGWSLPYRTDLPFFAEIEIVGPDLLEIGRVAAAFDSGAPDTASMARYGVCSADPDSPVKALWRAHGVRFLSPESARARFRPGAAGSPGADLDGAPTLLGQVTFGFTTNDFDAARGRVATLFGVDLEERLDEALGGRYLESRPREGEVSSLLVRPNALNRGSWLYPGRKEHALLLDVNLSTPSLLELGRIAAFVEGEPGDALSVVAYRALGDLVQDRVPRLLDRELASREEASSKWRSGHERHG